MRLGGAAKILDIDETRATAKFQIVTSEVTGYCEGKTMEPKDVSELKWNPAPGTSNTRDEAPLADLGKTKKNVGQPVEREKDLSK